MIGKPKYKKGDLVSFTVKPYKSEVDIHCVGKVGIVDAWGTFEQDEEPSYDVMVENWMDTGEPMFVKHIRESEIENV